MWYNFNLILDTTKTNEPEPKLVALKFKGSTNLTLGKIIGKKIDNTLEAFPGIIIQQVHIYE